MEKVTETQAAIGKVVVPRFEQKKRLWCGPAALQSLLAFNNFEVTQEEIVKGIGLRDGCFIQDLGLFALSKNFDVKIYSYDVMYLDTTWSKLSSIQINQKVIDYISRAELSNVSEEFYASLIKYISNGGEIFVELPTKDRIKSILDKGSPILVLVNSNSFYDRERLDRSGNPDDVMGKPGGHFVVIVGYDNGCFSIVDPSYDGPITEVDEDRFMFSLSVWGGWTMIINER